MANAAVLRALTAPGDTILVQSMTSGANISYHDAAVAGLLGLRAESLPGTYDFQLDAERSVELIHRRRPRVVVIGGSKVLFRYPLTLLRDAADAVGAYIVYDAAHLGPLIAAGIFDDPLVEGADVITTGTHKLAGGPIGGLVVTNDADLLQRTRQALYPAFLQTRDQNKYAAAVVSLAEMVEFCDSYSRAMVQNAKMLGSELAGHGFRVIGADRDFTDTHMLVLDAGTDAPELAAAFAGAGILVTKTNIFGESSSAIAASGVRLSVSQITRQGMGTDQAKKIAELMAAVRDGHRKVPAEVAALASEYPHVRYSFDDQTLGTT